MPGPRKKDDPLNIEGSGFHYPDRVVVSAKGGEAEGIVESIHQKRRKIDVRIDHPGHEEHGRVVTYDASEVTPHDDLLTSLKPGKPAPVA